MPSITESRIFPIRNKIFTFKNIREIAETIKMVGLEEEAMQLGKALEQLDTNSKEELVLFSTETLFTVKCFDNTLYTSDDIAILNDDSIVSKKRIESVKMEVIGQRKITFFLRHGAVDDKNEENNSFMSIEGTDNFWVNGLIGQFNEQLASIENQDNFLVRKNVFVKWLFVLSFIFSLTACKDWSDKGVKGYTPFLKDIFVNSQWDILLLLIFFGGLFGFFIIMAIYELGIEELFPSTELQTGLEYLQVEKRKRALYLVYLTAIIIPIAISLLFELLH